MTQRLHRRCPACWSTLEDAPRRCPHCGKRLHGSRAGRWTTLAAVLFAAGAATLGVTLFANGDDKGQPGEEPPAGAGTPDPGAAEAAPARVPVPTVRRPQLGPGIWRLSAALPSEPDLIALAIAAPGGRTDLVVPIERMPRRGAVLDGGEEVELQVIELDQARGWVLLTTTSALPATVEPIPFVVPARSGTLRALEANSSTELHAAATGDGWLDLDRSLDAPAALVTAYGNCAALAVGNRALDLGPIRPWLGQPPRRTFAAAQAQLRSVDPELASADAAELLAPPTSAERIRRAIALLDGALPRARGSAAVEHMTAMLADAMQALVRQLAPENLQASLAEGRTALARFPSHPGLLADLAQVAAVQGDTAMALELYDRLLAADPVEARTIADEVAAGVADSVAQRLRQQQYAEALAEAEAGAARFPDRADLRGLHARALWGMGGRSEALSEAAVAAGLDPRWEPLLASFRSAARAGRVEIPYDPRSGSIQARVTVNGRPVEVVVDTGASLTTVPVDFARQLDLLTGGNRRVKITSASDELTAPEVILPVLRIGSIEVRDVRAVALDLPGSLAGKGLLGLNVLRPLNLQIDDQNNRLILQAPAGK